MFRALACLTFLVGGCSLSHEIEPPPDAGPPCLAEEHPCDAPDDPIFSRDLRDDTHLVHWWLRDGCVPVSIGPDLVSREPDIERALASWAERGCSPFCATITMGAYLLDACDGERRLHFSPHAPEGATVTLFISGGTLEDVEIVVDETTTYAELLSRIGAALGLGNPAIGVSVPLVDGDEVLPEAHDAACVLYGPDPLCE